MKEWFWKKLKKDRVSELREVADGMVRSIEFGEGSSEKTDGDYLVFICLGISAVLLGAILPSLAEQIHTTIGQAVILFPASPLGNLASVILRY